MIKSKKITLLASAVVGSLFLLASVDAMAVECKQGRTKATDNDCAKHTNEDNCENKYQKDGRKGKFCEWKASELKCVVGRDECFHP